MWLQINCLPFANIVVEEESMLSTVIRAAIIIGAGFPLLLVGARLASRSIGKRAGPQAAFIASKAIVYIGSVLIILTILLQLGFNLTAILGAAGVATFAFTFAAQTSLSNLISGLFILWEQPFKVGDMVLINGTRGAVLSIDLLSVKMRTLDNLFVRVPNQSIIQSQVTNITRFPIRRMDVNVGVAYKEDVARILRILREIADANPFALDEPEPVIIFQEFGDSSLKFFMGVWFEKSNFLKLKNSIMQDIKERFDAENIEIPFPHLTLYAGSVTDPFPIKKIS